MSFGKVLVLYIVGPRDEFVVFNGAMSCHQISEEHFEEDILMTGSALELAMYSTSCEVLFVFRMRNIAFSSLHHAITNQKP